MKSKEEVNLMSPLTWAYIGDCVYELFIRTHLVETTNLKPHKLHIEAEKVFKRRVITGIERIKERNFNDVLIQTDDQVEEK